MILFDILERRVTSGVWCSAEFSPESGTYSGGSVHIGVEN
jgi:hypothetical protein